MPLLLIYLLLNAASLGAFFLGLRGRSRFAGVLSGPIFSALIAMRGLAYLHPAIEGFLFPWEGGIYLRDALPFFFAMLLLGLLFRRLPAHWTRTLRLAVVAIIFAAGLRMTHKLLEVTPLGKPLTADDHHHCHQSTMHTCAPAACVAALSYVNVVATEREMVERCLTTENGTSDYAIYCGLAASLRECHSPYRARMAEIQPDELAHAGRLAVITVMGHSHAVCTLGVGGSVIVHDPLGSTPQLWTVRQLKDVFGGVGTIIEPG